MGGVYGTGTLGSAGNFQKQGEKKKKKETGSTLSLRREPALLVDFNSQHGLGLLNTGN